MSHSSILYQYKGLNATQQMKIHVELRVQFLERAERPEGIESLSQTMIF